jgi:hypothetical protein
MQQFYDALEFKTFLLSQGYDVDHFTNEFQLESFCKKSQDFYYQEDRQPMFIFDDKKDKTYQVTLTKHKFDKNGTLTATKVKEFKFKSSIPYDNDCIVALEDCAWKLAWSKYESWMKQANFCTPSLKCKLIND